MCDFPILKTKLDTLLSSRKLFKLLIVDKHILSGEVVLWVLGFPPLQQGGYNKVDLANA